MTDIISLLTDMRNGKVLMDINDKFNTVLGAVLATGGKGDLTIKLFIKPSKMGMGGAVIEVETEHEAKTKLPELAVGRSFFFVNERGDLTREDPEQDALFNTEEPVNDRKSS